MRLPYSRERRQWQLADYTVTSRDWALIAEHIRTLEYDRDCPSVRQSMSAVGFAKLFKAHYPRFNPRKFIEACGVEWETWMDSIL